MWFIFWLSLNILISEICIVCCLETSSCSRNNICLTLYLPGWRDCFISCCAKVYTSHNSRLTKVFGLNFFCNNLNTNATYKANKLVLSICRSSLGLDQKKSTYENPQIISICTANNKMTIESNSTTQNVLNGPNFESGNDKKW